MNPDRWRRLEAVFESAVERRGQERSDFVAVACDGDPELRSEVERLLQNHENPTRFLDPPTSGLLGQLESDAPLPDRIGSYRVVRLIASGGMGTVYLAQQDHPRRAVALKVARTALASRWALRRFEHEAEILARLKHPGIAQVYEAGTITPAPGAPPLPFFAMEFVEGASAITEFASRRNLSIADRLRLFIEVCDSVQHATRLGVVHRDLKPQNILVDDSGRVKVIDFGLARAAAPDAAHAPPAETVPGQIIGTIAYMSPEHLAAEPHAVDTRSDVYSLGVVLYELVCGALPYDVRGKSIADAAGIIQSSAPIRPSQARREMHGDLETVILKALEKDPDRRYQCAADMARDLERYLRHEPVVARRPTAAYRFRKFVRRRWPLVAGGAVVAAALLAATVVSVVFALRETRIAREETRQREIAVEAAALLDGALSAADPAVAGPDTTVREMLERTAADIDARRSALRPEVEAAVRARLGRSFVSLAEYTSARRQFEASLTAADRGGLTGADVLETTDGLATVCVRLSDAAAALTWSQRDLDLARKLCGAESAEYARALRTMCSALILVRRYDEAMEMGRSSLALRERLFGPDDPIVADSLGALGTLVHLRGGYAEAETMLRRAVDLARRDATTGAGELRLATILGNLGVTAMSTGKTQEAEALQREVIQMLTRRLRPEHMNLQIARIRLALLLERRGAWAEAEELHRLNFQSLRAAKEPSDANLAMAADRWAEALCRLGRYPDAEATLREELALRRKMDAKVWGEAAGTMQSLAVVLLKEGRPKEAEEQARRALELRESGHGAAARVLTARSVLGECLLEQGRVEEAEALIAESHEALKAELGEADERTQEAARRLTRWREVAGVSR